MFIALEIRSGVIEYARAHTVCQQRSRIKVVWSRKHIADVPFCNIALSADAKDVTGRNISRTSFVSDRCV